MSSIQDPEAELKVHSTLSQRIIAGGIILAFLYWASSVVMTVMFSVLVAYMLDPVVEWLERFRVPRGVGALIVLLVTLGLLSMLGYLVWDRVEHFADDWPQKYAPVLKQATAKIEEKLERFEREVSRITPEQRASRLVRIAEGTPVRSWLLAGLGSLYSILLFISFVPFLVFFMLAAKRDVWHATLQLFPSTERTRVKQALEAVSAMLRSYVIGNLLVAGILAVVSWIFFAVIGLDYPFLTGFVSGVLNLVPYLGAVLAWVPPMVVGLTKYNSITPFVGIAAVLGFFHLIAVNVLMPALVGKKVHLNALAVTVALLFWGWMWGGIGLVLAIPITATMKVVCDYVDDWQPVGRWMGT
jgi:predicted PurR-regulated permease PerM